MALLPRLMISDQSQPDNSEQLRWSDSAGAKSLWVWAAYTLALGLSLILIPNTILSLFGVATTEEVWIRVLGVAVTSQSALYWYLARHPVRAGLMITVAERVFAAVALAALAIMNGPWQLALFAMVELVGGSWTYLQSRRLDIDRPIS